MDTITATIDRLYEAFSTTQRPRRIDGCPCCVSSDELCALVDAPLRALTSEQLSSYASSVLLTAGSEQDFRYLVPRILELSIHESDWWPNREVVLGKLALAGWDKWPSSQRLAITEAVTAAFMHEVQPACGSAWEVDGWLCGLAIAGVDLEPLLEHLSAPGNEQVLFDLYEINSAHLSKGKLCNAFWSDHRESQAPVLTWFQSERVQEIIARIQQERYGAA
jgi:hypothetical protein